MDATQARKLRGAAAEEGVCCAEIQSLDAPRVFSSAADLLLHFTARPSAVCAIMAKAAVAAVLQKTLGPFVDGIDAKSLELSVWDGDVKLDQLQLRTSALAALELPLRVVGARLGSVRVQIPWRNLGGEPMIVTVDRLFLVLAPKSTTAAYDASKEAAASDEAKRAQLAAWEAEQAAAAQVDASFAERLATRLLGKLVVKITNVHVRVESGRDDGGASLAHHPHRPPRSHGRLPLQAPRPASCCANSELRTQQQPPPLPPPAAPLLLWRSGYCGKPRASRARRRTWRWTRRRPV